MKKFKVELIETKQYCFDVLCENEMEAKRQAYEKFKQAEKREMKHYFCTSMETDVSTVYDVTNTDDPFNP